MCPNKMINRFCSCWRRKRDGKRKCKAKAINIWKLFEGINPISGFFIRGFITTNTTDLLRLLPE